MTLIKVEHPIYDLAIIGGGIAGAGIARDASLRGARTLLFEKNTLGSGTSSKSSKLIHGGLRYLEIAWNHLLKLELKSFWKNLRFVFLALRETHILQKTAPELIREIPILVPIYRNSKRSRLSVYFGTTLYGLFSILTGGSHFSKILWSRESVLKIEPSLNPDGLIGGTLVWDHTTDDQALVKAVTAQAIKKKADVFEQTQVINYLYDYTQEFYVINTLQNGQGKTFYARKLVNASGPWADQVRSLDHEKTTPMIAPIAGAHLNVKPFCRNSVILEAEDRRIFFVIRRESDCRIGTTERTENNPDEVRATEEEVSYLLNAVGHFFPKASLTATNIINTDAGIRPLARPKNMTSASQISREHAFVTSPNGILHILGVKLTDHRRAAQEAVDYLMRDLKKWNPQISEKSLTAVTSL